MIRASVRTEVPARRPSAVIVPRTSLAPWASLAPWEMRETLFTLFFYRGLLCKLGILRKIIKLIKNALAAQVDPVHFINFLDCYKDLISCIYRILKPGDMIVADLAYVEESLLAREHLYKDAEIHHPCGCPDKCLPRLDFADEIVDYPDRCLS